MSGPTVPLGSVLGKVVLSPRALIGQKKKKKKNKKGLIGLDVWLGMFEWRRLEPTGETLLLLSEPLAVSPVLALFCPLQN